MLVDAFYQQSDAGQSSVVSFTREQASRFAKEVADDFNPLHDIDAKRFCVPGDLLFALVLANYGVSQHMAFNFKGMVTEETRLVLPAQAPALTINGDNDKQYLTVDIAGDNSDAPALIDSLTKSYVTFSGHTFPHVLIPLMLEENVMINPSRPMVMYESMLIDLNRLDLADITLELDKASTRLEVNGKRGNVCLAFNLLGADGMVGRGEKHMLLSGLQPYDQQAMDQIVDDYNLSKQAYRPTPVSGSQALA